MDMLKVEPAELRRRAEVHAQAIDTITAARAENGRIVSDSHTLGPMYHEVRRAVDGVTKQREVTLAAEQARHERMRDELLTAAAQYEAIEAENVRRASAPREV